jgi:hypothetical protein
MTSGIPSRGNMKPDSRIVGRKAKNDACIACRWVRDTVEMRIPCPSVAR